MRPGSSWGSWGFSFFFPLWQKSDRRRSLFGRKGVKGGAGIGGGGCRGGSFQTAETTLLHFATNRACVNSLFAMRRSDFADGN